MAKSKETFNKKEKEKKRLKHKQDKKQKMEERKDQPAVLKKLYLNKLPANKKAFSGTYPNMNAQPTISVLHLSRKANAQTFPNATQESYKPVVIFQCNFNLMKRMQLR